MAQGPMPAGAAASRSAAHPSAAAGRGRGGAIAVGLLVAAVIAAVVVYLGWSRLFSSDPFELTRENYKSLATAATPIQPSDARYVDGAFEGKPTLTIVGQGSVSTAEAFPVAPAKRYLMRVRIRVAGAEPPTAAIPVTIGVATFNEAGELETDAPGAHRYFLTVARPLTAAEGLVTMEGTITGSGNESYGTFRPGTKSVRPIVLAKGRSESDRTEVVEILFGEVTQKYPETDGGKK